MTSERVRVVGLGGTKSPGSSSLVALRVVLAAAAERGADTELFDLGTLDIPIYEWGVPPPPAVASLVTAFAAADAIVWASPLYHGTISGIFKNAIDWLELLNDKDPPYLADKPVGLIGVAAGAQALQAITAMDHIARSLRAWTVPLVVPINRSQEVIGKDGTIKDERTDKQLRTLGFELVRSARIFATARREPASP
ncbi:MAG: NAD(P)H-dependent oxidoreductase [Polyangiaceae bacterium]